ncbi:MAG: hypothetical protein KIT09_28030 [Bryobacteraceae bacterium]|nr:hypothetical protein [Bryobacteraceae bacterium]
MTAVDVEGGQIVVQPSLADLMACGRTGGAWDARRKAWIYPATPRHARLVRSAFKRVAATERFESLLAGASGAHAPTTVTMPAVEAKPSAAGPPAFELPGLRTSPWRHQVAAFDFCMDHFARGLRGLLLACGMGALARVLWPAC